MRDEIIMKLTDNERGILLDAIGMNRDGMQLIVCNACGDPINVRRDEQGRALETSCKCGKYNSTFRPI